ncbi:MAG: restriction endonuclease subunit S [Planctomycetota bacterium]|jgi:type I restriction enzyme S subunit
MTGLNWVLDRRKFLSEPEAKQLFETARKLADRALIFDHKVPVRDYFIVHLALATGLRVMEIAHLRPMNVNTDGQINLTDIKYIHRDKAKSENKLLSAGDVLFNNTNSPELVGKTALYSLQEKTAFSNHMTRIQCAAGLSPSFCAHYLHQKWREGYFFDICTKHISQASVSRKKLQEIDLPLPPVNEQKRIVEVVEKLLIQVNNAKDLLGSPAEAIKRFRKSVFNAACTGKLTEDWRKKHGKTEITKELLGENFPSDWQFKKINELASKVGSGATPRGGQKSYKKTGIPLIRSQNIHIEGFKKEGLVFIDEKQAYALKNVKVKTNDVLINITGASIGRVSLAPNDMNGARVNQHVCIIRPKSTVLPMFLYVFLASPIMQKHIMREQYGVTRQALTKTQISNFTIPSPSTYEQQEIVCRVVKLFKLTNKIEDMIKEARLRVEKLTQSILAKAFKGELVPTEAKLARIEGRGYETAKELLHRIADAKLTESNDKEKKKMTRQLSRKHIKKPIRRSLIDLIYENPKGITPENLLREANYTIEEIDDFYCNLSNIIQEIEEVKPLGNQAKKWPTNNKVLIKPKKV